MAKRPLPVGPGTPKKKQDAPKEPPREKLIVENRKARHDYEVLETMETGIVLAGTEVKSLRAGRVNIQDAYVIVKNGELFLLNAKIDPYVQGGIFNHESKRTRKLLAKKTEIERWAGKMKEKSLTGVCLKLYLKGSRVKALVGLARGKKEYDRREDIKGRELDREAGRAMRRGRR